MMRRWLKYGVLAVFILISSWALADSPVTLLQNVANKMLTELAQNKSQLKQNPAIIHRIVNDVLVPVIDVNRMAGMVVGRQYWYSAPPDQRREFVKLFKRLVINTYSNALASYDDDKVIVYQTRENVNARVITLSSAIVRKSGQKIVINYNLVNTAGQWKVYDFSVENVSIVQNYHSQFANTLANGGMAELIKELNRRMR